MCVASVCEPVFEMKQEEFPTEWKRMYDELEYTKINWKRGIDMSVWQYKSVCQYDGKLVHFFTCQKHPYTKRSEYICIPLTEDFKKIVEEKLNTKVVEEKKVETVLM